MRPGVDAMLGYGFSVFSRLGFEGRAAKHGTQPAAGGPRGGAADAERRCQNYLSGRGAESHLVVCVGRPLGVEGDEGALGKEAEPGGFRRAGCVWGELGPGI